MFTSQSLKHQLLEPNKDKSHHFIYINMLNVNNNSTDALKAGGFYNLICSAELNNSL